MKQLKSQDCIQLDSATSHQKPSPAVKQQLAHVATEVRGQRAQVSSVPSSLPIRLKLLSQPDDPFSSNMRVDTLRRLTWEKGAISCQKYIIRLY